MDDQGIKQICHNLKQLTHLGACHNYIGLDGLNYIVKLPCLIDLDISYNNIGDEGIKIITGNLKHQLTRLDVSSTQMTNQSVKQFSEMKQLTQLKISGIEMDSEGLKNISEMKQLTQLEIPNCNLKYQDLIHISELRQLTLLDISYNDIEQENCYELRSCLDKLIHFYNDFNFF